MPILPDRKVRLSAARVGKRPGSLTIPARCSLRQRMQQNRAGCGIARSAAPAIQPGHRGGTARGPASKPRSMPLQDRPSSRRRAVRVVPSLAQRERRPRRTVRISSSQARRGAAARGHFSQANASNSRAKTVQAARSYTLRPASPLVRRTTATPETRSTTNRLRHHWRPNVRRNAGCRCAQRRHANNF